MLLPINLILSQMQTRWKALIDPVLSNPVTNPTILTGVKLVVGTNVVNHLLGQLQQGWFITDINAAASIYRSAPFNNLTLTLHSSAVATISLVVF